MSRRDFTCNLENGNHTYSIRLSSFFIAFYCLSKAEKRKSVCSVVIARSGDDVFSFEIGKKTQYVLLRLSLVEIGRACSVRAARNDRSTRTGTFFGSSYGRRAWADRADVDDYVYDDICTSYSAIRFVIFGADDVSKETSFKKAD